MNPRLRLGLEIILLIAIFAVALFAFNQYQVLTDTQDTLALVEGNSTALAEQAAASSTQAATNLENAQSTARQSAAEANATSTENSRIIASNYGTETRVAIVNSTERANLVATSNQAAENAAATSSQSAEDYSTAQAILVATSNQSAEDASIRLDNANATGTESASNASSQLDNANATSTQAAVSANDAADVAASQIAALNSNIADLDNDLDDSRDVSATQGAELELADATIAAQQEEIEVLRESSNETDNGNGENLVFVETNNLEMYVSEDYFIVNYDEDYQDVIDELYDMGGEFREFAGILEENAEFLELGIVLREDVDDYAAEIMYIFSAESLFNISLDDYMDTAFETIEEDAELLELDVIELGGQEVGRAIMEFDGDFLVYQAHYVLQDGRIYWHIVYTTTSNDIDERLDDFDASVGTIRLR